MTNPLSKYFRQPSIHLELPSQGRYWDQAALELPETGQIPIYPMTARDEITIRTPDALINGSGMVDIIQSCCPAIKNAWSCPNIDVDALLIGIRIASYGPTMDFNSNCPHCQHKNLHGIDLLDRLSRIKSPDYNALHYHKDLVFKFKPIKYFQMTKENNINFQEQKIYQALQRPDTEVEIRNKELADSMKRLVEMNLESIAVSTDFIQLPDGNRVSDTEFLREFYNNASGALIKDVQKWMADINSQISDKESEVKCENCTKDYTVPIEYDFANFFV